MNYIIDFKKPLHIFFNEDAAEDKKDTLGDKIDSFSELIDKFGGLQKLILEYNLDKYLLLLNTFHDDLEIYTWIHPNIKRSLKDSEHSYPALIIADTLKKEHPEIKFNLISRHPAGAPKEITDNYTVYPITILNKLLEHSLNAQRISTLRGIEKSLTNHLIETNTKKNRIDFAIVTALFDDEFQNVIKVFDLKQDSNLNIGNKRIYSGRLKAFPDKKVIGIYQTSSGRTDASTLTTEIIKEFNPRYIFMTGVCGGNSDTSFGDIVVAKFVFTFNKGKISDEGFFRELELVKINEDEIRKIVEHKEELLLEVKKQLIADTSVSEKYKDFNYQNLKVSIDPVACSDMVINKTNYFNEMIKIVERKVTAVEMESYGFARAAESTNSGTTTGIIIKSVMDNTVNKNDKAKPYASHTSALFLKTLLERGTIL